MKLRHFRRNFRADDVCLHMCTFRESKKMILELLDEKFSYV